jgi:hypothetical protein
MNKKPLFIGGFLLILLILLVWIQDNNANATKRKNYYSNWDKKHFIDSKEPNGLFFLKELLEKHSQDSVFIANNFEDLNILGQQKDSVIYLFVGDHLELQVKQWKAIKSSLDSGATAIFAFDKVSENMYKDFFKPQAYYWEYSDDLYAWIEDTSLRYMAEYQNDTIYSDWWLFEKSRIKDTTARMYAFALNEPIAFYQKQNKGFIHFHSNPRFFENYQLRKPTGLAYLELLIKRIPKNKKIVWLSFARGGKPSNSPSAKGEGSDVTDSSLLRYVLENPILSNSFLGLLILMLLYALFRSKRIEPLLQPKQAEQNASISFVQTLGSIYLSKNNPASILKLMRKNFFINVNRFFFIDLNLKDKLDEQMARLAEKSNFDQDKLAFLKNELCKRPKDFNVASISEVNTVLREFYLLTGIIKPSKTYLLESQEQRYHRNLIIAFTILMFAMLMLLRGAYLLTISEGIGAWFALLSIPVFWVGGRYLNRPILELKQNELIFYNFFFGKKVGSLKGRVTVEYSKDLTTFEFENEQTILIKNVYLGARSKKNLAHFVTFLKNKQESF